MDGRRSANQFNTSTAISLITLLLRRNGFHLSCRSRRLDTTGIFYTQAARFKIQSMKTADGTRSVDHEIYKVQDTRSQRGPSVSKRQWLSYVCIADVQDHKAELAVLILVQLVDQLSVVSLQQKTHITNSERINKTLCSMIST